MLYEVITEFAADRAVVATKWAKDAKSQDEGAGFALLTKCFFISRTSRITSYNVCYTKVLRNSPTSEPGGNFIGPGCKGRHAGDAHQVRLGLPWDLLHLLIDNLNLRIRRRHRRHTQKAQERKA